MQIIYKYPLQMTQLQTIKVPISGEPIPKVLVQDNTPVLYFAVDTENMKLTEYHVLIAGTGQPLPENINEWLHIDSIQMDPYVWHIFILPAETDYKDEEDLSQFDLY